MKFITFITLLGLITPLAAQNEVNPTEKKRTAYQEAFSNLPEEKRKEFVKYFQEASRLFQQKRIFETLEEIDKAQKIFTESPELYNLRGSCYVEMRSFDKALVEFEKARVISPYDLSLKFNIAEVNFVTGEWKKSADLFEEVLKVIPANSVAMARLTEFKIMLCKKKLGLTDEVMILSKKYDFMDDSPYYYFAEAALAYDRNDSAKAEEWLGIASRVFRDPTVISAWQDAFVEYGYFKSFHGEEKTTAK